MISRLLAIALLFLCCSFPVYASGKAPITLLESSPHRSVLKIQLTGFTSKMVDVNGQQKAVIGANGGVPLLVKDSPDLPKFSTSLIIPEQAEMVYEVLEAKYRDYPNTEIAPSKGTVSRQFNIADIAYREGKVYQEDSFFPGDLVKLDNPYVLRDFHGQVVNLQPFQYNPVTQVLRVYEELTVAVYNKNASKGTSLALPNTIDPNFMAVYQDHFLNASLAAQSYILSEQGPMLILCADSYSTAMAPFVAWKNQIGIPTTLVPMSAVGNSTNAIKSYVANYYNQYGLTYLLLVGDAQHITPMNFSYSGDSDNGYGYIVGNDRYPDIIVGRMSAETVAHVNTQVNRTISYEKYPDLNGSWYSRGMGIASNQGPGDDNEYDYQHLRNIRGQLLAYTYTNVAEMYDGSQGIADANGNPTPIMVKNEVENGLSIINYTGHGGSQGFVTSGFSNSDVNSLSNTVGWPFIISVACVNGDFVNQTCFAEAWLRASYNGLPTGAVATVMSTINQYWNQPMEGQDQMNAILTENVNNNIKRTFGGIVVNGLIQMNDTYGYSGMDMTDTWTIFGDPSVMVRTGTAQPMAVTHSTMELLGLTQLAVNCNKEGALIALSRQGTLIGTGTVAQGSVVIAFPAILSIDSIDVTATAFNCVPYFGKTYVQCPANIVNLSANNVTICAGASATLSASGAIGYSWNTASSSPTVVVTPLATTVFSVTGTLNYVCFQTKTVVVVVHPLPVVSFTMDGPVCENAGQVSLTAQPAGGSYAGVGISGAYFSPQLAGIGAHQLSYTYTDATSCANTVSTYMIVSYCTSINPSSGTGGLCIYPVPASGQVSVKGLKALGATSIRLYNAIGQLLWENHCPGDVDDQQIDTSPYPRGIYILRVNTQAGSRDTKIVLD